MRATLFTVIIALFSLPLLGQTPETLAKKYLEDTKEEYNLSEEDLSDWTITDEYVGRNSGVHHIYLRQRYQGIEIFSADAAVHILPNGTLLTMNNQFFADLESRIASIATPGLSAKEAVRAAAVGMNYPVVGELNTLKRIGGAAREVVFEGGEISDEDIPMKLVYQPDEEGKLFLAWDMSIYEPNHQNWWHMRVDATTGEILDKVNWVVSCDFGHAEEESTTHSCEESCTNHDRTDVVKSSSFSTAAVMNNSYRVFPEPVESPIHGSRALITDPANTTASPYGWHDTNGAAGAEFTYTRGNNVWAQEDRNGNNGIGYSPDGGANLIFDFPLDLTQAPSFNEDNNITNLFYWNNLIHDVLYIYGLDEAAGNFQENNYGRGGLGSDHVWGDAQDGGGTNNANFGTPPDGSNPRMQMFLWTAANPDRDGDLDNGIIVHEYGHGISNRLTGGGSNTSCLGNAEQMGEGWSDWYGLMFTIESGDAGSDSRGIGNYATNRPANGSGIRAFPYTTNMAVNPDTYDRIKTTSSVHRTGSVWCAMIWEVTWALIDQYGFDPDIYYGTGGNNVAMQLITEGMALQPCRPGFVDGRDAILAADVALYDGANQCEIWNAFAKRGLGFSATQGSTSSRTDGNEAFDLPPSIPGTCSSAPDFMVGINPIRGSLCAGSTSEFTVSVLSANGFNTPVTLAASNLPGAATATFTPATVTPPGTAIVQISNTAGISAGTYTIDVTGTGNAIMQTGSVVVTVDPVLSPPNLLLPADGSTEISVLQNFDWSGVTNAAGYDIEIATDMAFNTIVETGSNLSTSSYTSQRLAANTTHYWRVRTRNNCGGGSWSSVRSFTIQACGGIFLDSGGANNDHGDLENFTWVICPDVPGEIVKVDFTAFDLEEHPNGGCYDYLEVFNGDDINAPSFGQFCDAGLSNAPGGGSIDGGTNPTGCLTFVFFSDQFVNEDGWEANVSCVSCIAPTVNSAQITNASCLWSEDGSMLITAGFSNPIEYLLIQGSSTSISSTGQFNNLGVGTYGIQVREIGNAGCISSVTNFTVNADDLDNTIIYVDQDASGLNNGTSWANAYPDLQDGLNAATDCNQVWVKAATYVPTHENPFTSAFGPRDRSFAFNDFIGVFGGFDGTENNRADRKSALNITTLNGNFNSSEPISDNSWHTVWVEGTGGMIDGFSITRGNADDANSPHNKGGGIYINGSNNPASPMIKNCFIRSNNADEGAGVYHAGNTGGGSSSPTYVNTLFSGNIAASNGGAIFSDGTGGGSSNPVIINGTFIGNEAVSGQGGALYNDNADAEISNSIFWENIGTSKSIHNNNGSNPLVNNSLLEEASCPAGATCNTETQNLFAQDPLFKDANGTDNVFGTDDDNVQLMAGSPALEAGVWDDSPTADFRGRSRAQGHAIDLGIFESPSVQVSVRAMLQGAYDSASGLMRTDLAAGSLIPTTEPFTALGFVQVDGGGGETSSQAVFTDEDIVDWVFVELRDANDFNVIIATRSALLKSNGLVVDMDGVSPLAFFDKTAGNFHVAIRHRNHLGAVSASSLGLSNNVVNFNLITTNANALGGNLSLIDLGGGIFGLPAGDLDYNGQVQNVDQNDMVPLIGTAGYSTGDLDLNGQIQNAELQVLLIPNTGRGVQYNY